MNDYKISAIMLSKIKPKMFNKDWMDANKLLGEFQKKAYKKDELKEKHFVYLVNKIFEEEEKNENR